MTVPMDEVREVAYMMGDVRKRVIIDATSFNLTRNSGYVNTASVLKAITGCPHIVKCYNKTGYEELVDEEIVSEGIDIFMASDSKKGKEMVKLLAKDLCLGECYDFGGNEMVSTLDEMAICWHNQSVKSQANKHILYKMPRR
jgi:predicted dinucleotide-binding enzyme